MLRFTSLLGLTAALLSIAALAPDVAEACGGCFAPVGQPSVVRAHRMVVSISDRETTLWDQFEYAGAPEDFVWVLPIASGESVEIALADQSFFQYLSDRTRVTLQGPITSPGGGFGCGDAGGYAASDSPDVTVYSRDVVGPYETAIVGSEDATSLGGWLTDNGYAIPEALEPTIAHYVDEGMAFAVLRLAPNAGVSQIQPVRVTAPGANPTFPLRMVAAGVAGEVSLELYVLGEGRWEAQSFPNAEIDEAELVFDQSNNRFNYDDLAAELLASNEGRTWLTEFADAIGPPPPGAYVTWDEGGYHGPLDDWEIATRHLGDVVTVTRMRAVLPVDALDEDLVLRASTLGPRPGFYSVDRASTVAPTGGGMPGAQLLVALAAALLLAPRRRREERATG